ncbi:MAG TPA: YhgN family NAAT transporter [Bryobacteraceae bacterium]|jgi:multiple antibiotic resistance protein|nr:YhgN family NAAT transporter [Bryobacteraceae bacterium]
MATVYDPDVDLLSAVVTLFLIMDPLGNIPPFLSALKPVAPARRRIVLIREVAFAYVLLLAFLFLGRYILQFLRLEQETISVAGGIVLFLIALRMIFPAARANEGDLPQGEPFVVPLAVPLFAGPSVLAALLLMQRTESADMRLLFTAVTIAWALSSVILLSSTFFYRILGERGLIALERLMGMLLVMIAVQMLMTGLKTYFRP